MQDIRKFKIGMRTIKTGLSVALSLILSELLHLKNPSLVGIAAIVSMQSSVNESFIAGKNRILGTFVGAVIGLFFSYFLPHNYFFLIIGIIAVIHIHNLFKWKQSLSLSVIVFLIVFLYQDGDISRLQYAIHRLLDTSIGVVVSMFINYFIAQPDNKKSLIYIENHLYGVIKKLVYDVATNINQIDNSVFREELDKYNNTFEALRNELYMDSSRSSSSKSALYIVTTLEKVEKNLLTLLELNIIPILDEENRSLFQQLYSEESFFEEYTAPQREPNNLDIIYNYHINKIFHKLLLIEAELL